ncbi:hypothetical protein SH668x_002815 [Planctomicrobium sp. SH668]|uniref:hypothetical protein n=1 Tax=Planctomicrobium sp. SH668 TaxID=3448126 RepID=UPI003F5B4E64
MNQAAAKENPCPECGEMVRVNSLRCWNCGAFMNPELEQKYMEMQANPAPVILSEVPANEMSSFESNDDEDDFQLSVPSIAHRPAVQQVESKLQPPVPDVSESFLDEPAEPSPAEEKPVRQSAGDDNVSHSVATGGDALLDIARQEEKEVKQRLKGRKLTGPVVTAGGGLIIYCPYGCKVEVKQEHRGMTGKCPRCAAPFIVPVDPPQYKKPTVAAAASAPGEDKFKTWITDLHVHAIEPEKLKLKADSLLKEFIEADVGFSPDQLVVAVLAKKGGGGMFGKGGDKKETVREQMLAYVKEDKPLNDLPVGEKYIFTVDEVSQIRVVQPTTNRGASLFHGVPVFGTGRIAVQLPMQDGMKHPTYISFGITEFWKFAKAIEENYGIVGLGVSDGVPSEAKTTVNKDHYSDMLIKTLESPELFQADPTAKLEVVAYRCGACKTVVSEVSRKKENLGGKSPKGIAKAKCPKCSQKMGENLLYALKQDAVDPSMSNSSEEA